MEKMLPKILGYGPAVLYLILAVPVAGAAVIKAISRAGHRLGEGGLWSAHFELFFITLPWSAIFEIRLPKEWAPSYRNWDYKLGEFLNDKGIHWNYLLYALFLVLNTVCLLKLGSVLGRIVERAFFSK